MIEDTPGNPDRYRVVYTHHSGSRIVSMTGVSQDKAASLVDLFNPNTHFGVFSVEDEADDGRPTDIS